MRQLLLLSFVAGGLAMHAEGAAQCQFAGRDLTCPQLNFRMTAPDGWSWAAAEQTGNASDEQFTFTARRDARTFFTLFVRGKDNYDNSDVAMKHFTTGLNRGVTRSGNTITDLKTAAVKVPAGEGQGFSYVIHTPKGDALADGFVLSADRMYILQYVSASREELDSFKTSVQSLQLAAPVSQPVTHEDRASNLTTIAFMLYGVLFVVGWGAGKLINRFAGRRVANAAAVGVIFMLPVFFGEITMIFKAVDRLVSASAEKQGELVGEMLGPGLIAVIVAGGLAISESKRAKG